MTERADSEFVRTLRREDGYTLVEFMFVAVLLVVVLMATLAVFDTTGRVAPKDQERAHALRDAQQQLHRMTRELRQAYAVNGQVTGDFIDFNVRIAGASRHVSYDCTRPATDRAGNSLDDSSRACARREGPVGQALGPERILIDRVVNHQTANPAVFIPNSPTRPTFVRVRLAVPASGEREWRDAQGAAHDAVLDDGVFLRNLALVG